MPKSDFVEVRGTVVQALPNAMFRVKLGNDTHIMCHISGKLRQNSIRILPDDEVTVAISPYDTTKGRITIRH